MYLDKKSRHPCWMTAFLYLMITNSNPSLKDYDF